MGDNRDSNRGGYSGQQGNARRSGQRKPAGRRPQFGDPEIADKLREIESDGEPMSLAEQISREKKRPLADIENAEARTADEINVTELQRSSPVTTGKMVPSRKVLTGRMANKAVIDIKDCKFRPSILPDFRNARARTIFLNAE